MLKIRRSRDRLIFNMGIPIPGKDGLYIETGPWSYHLRQQTINPLMFISIPPTAIRVPHKYYRITAFPANNPPLMLAPNGAVNVRYPKWQGSLGAKPALVWRFSLHRWSSYRKRVLASQWRHNKGDGVSNPQRLDCLLNVCSCADQRKHQSSASLAFVRGILRWPVNSPHKWPVTRKMFPFDDVIMDHHWFGQLYKGFLH